MAKAARAQPAGADTAGWLPLAFLFGLLDGASGLSYLLHVEIVPWYAAIVTAKIVTLILIRPKLWLPSPVAWLMTGGVALLIVASMFADESTQTGVAAAAGFMVQLVVTLLVVRGEQVRNYARGAASIIALTAALHIAGVLTHRVTVVWGRYSFFGSSEPNLGSEINAAGAIAAALAFSRPRATAIILMLLIDTNYMQGRSALMAEVMTLFVIYSFDAERTLRSRRALAVMGLSGAALLIGIALGADQWVQRQVNEVFFVNSATRGISTGFSGRKVLWDIALSQFHENPLIGHGLGSYETIGFIGPHNIVLFGLGEDGLLSLLFLTAIVYGFIEAARRSTYASAALLCALPLFAFNDRFINLNPYPFLICAFLAAIAGAPLAAKSVRPVRRAPRQVRAQAAAPLGYSRS